MTSSPLSTRARRSDSLVLASLSGALEMGDDVVVTVDERDGDGAETFEAVVDLLNHPLFVVTSEAGGERAGCLVGFATQVSIQPPRFLVGLSNKNHTYTYRAEHLAVHLFSAEQRDMARLFAHGSADASWSS